MRIGGNGGQHLGRVRTPTRDIAEKKSSTAAETNALGLFVTMPFKAHNSKGTKI